MLEHWLGSGLAALQRQGGMTVDANQCGACRWLAMDLGLPVEAPKEATRGWDIASLQKGVHGLHAQHAALLGLFSR